MLSFRLAFLLGLTAVLATAATVAMMPRLDEPNALGRRLGRGSGSAGVVGAAAVPAAVIGAAAEAARGTAVERARPLKAPFLSGALAADRVPMPLPGSWLAVANGDRVRDLLWEGDVLWAAAEGGGVVRWDLALGEYRQYLAPQDGLPSSDVRALARDRSGTLWAATARGVARYHEPGDGWRLVASPPEIGPAATALALAPDGGLWVGFEQQWDGRAAGPDGGRGAFVGGGLGRLNSVTGAWLSTWQAEAGDGGGWRTVPSNNLSALAFTADGLLWAGSRPFFLWREDLCSSPPCEGAWSRRGGGLAALDPAAGRWAHWGGTDSETCVSDTIHDLAPDAARRMWVATRGDGLQAFRLGLATEACGAGHSVYKRVVGGQPLPGTKVWAVAVAEDGRVYSGVGGDRGYGVAVLDHGGTFGAGDGGVWSAVGLEDIQGPVDPLVSALAVAGGGLVAGTLDSRDDRGADGYGIKMRTADGRWRSFKTAASGLASNRVSAVAMRPGGEVWFGTDGRGVSRWDGQRWQTWRAYGRHEVAAVLATTSPVRAGRLVLDTTLDAYRAAFPESRAPARLGQDDPVLYELYGAAPVPGGVQVQVFPPPEASFPPGLAVYSVRRGPAGDRVTGLALESGGRLWLTAWPSLARRPNPDFGETECDDAPDNGVPDCDWDGGLAAYEGGGPASGEAGAWRAWEPSRGGLPSRQAQAVLVDRVGQVWVGTGGAFGGGGRGAAVYAPSTGGWTRHTRAGSGAGFGFDNVSGLAEDPVTGHLWLTSQGRPTCPTATSGRDKCPAIQGAVSRWDGSVWQAWSRQGSPPATGLAEQGALDAIRFDRGRGRVWVGGWEGERNFHWNEGVGLNATVDGCPRTCQGDGWSGVRFEDDGSIRALAVDGNGRVWAGGHRNGSGLVPPVGGLKILIEEVWTEHNTATTPLPSNNITALDAVGQTVWVGTWERGAMQWRPAVLNERAYLPRADR